jgi:hypothetical protein
MTPGHKDQNFQGSQAFILISNSPTISRLHSSLIIINMPEETMDGKYRVVIGDSLDIATHFLQNINPSGHPALTAKRKSTWK